MTTPRNDETPGCAGVCQCAEPCLVCKCNSNTDTPETQDDPRQRITAAIQRFAHRPRHRRQKWGRA